VLTNIHVGVEKKRYIAFVSLAGYVIICFSIKSRRHWISTRLGNSIVG